MFSEWDPGILTGREPILSGTELGRSKRDLSSISVPKAAAAGPRWRDGVCGDGVCGGWTRRPHRAAARQSNLVISLAQRVAASATAWPLHRSRSDRYGRLRQAASQWPRLVSLRRAPPLPRALLEALDVRERVTFVIHDWGSALGFDWSNRHREAVKGIAYMEAIAVPQRWDHWDKFGMRPALQGLRSAAGEEMVLRDNFFIEQILPKAILRILSDEEMAAYRRPFAEPGEGRRPTLTWPREIPVEGEPADVVAIVRAYADWLATSDVPKLFIKAEPGGILANDADLAVVRRFPAQTEVTVAGIHYVQEDSPDEIGRAIADWMRTLG